MFSGNESAIQWSRALPDVLTEGLTSENQTDLPRESRAALLSTQAKTETVNPSPRCIKFECSECDWTGDGFAATDHHRRTRHQLTTVEVLNA